MNTKKNIIEVYLSRQERLALKRFINEAAYYGFIVILMYAIVYMFAELLFNKI